MEGRGGGGVQRSQQQAVVSVCPPHPLYPLSKSIFSTMFLGLMLSSWLQMNTLPGSGSVHPYLLIHTFSCASEGGQNAVSPPLPSHVPHPSVPTPPPRT